MLKYILLAAILIQTQCYVTSALENCNRTTLNYDYQIGLVIYTQTDDETKQTDITDYLNMRFKEEFLSYLKTEYPENFLQLGENFELYYCTDDFLNVPSKSRRLNIKIKKDGLFDKENMFYDTILLEMISINHTRYRAMLMNAEDTDFKIRELWNSAKEPENYKLPVWIIVLLATSGTIGFAAFLFILRECFDCSIEDAKVKKAFEYQMNGIDIKSKENETSTDPSMINNITIASNNSNLSRKPSLVVSPKDKNEEKPISSNSYENNSAKNSISKSAKNSISKSAKNSESKNRFKGRKDVKGLEDYENIKVEPTNSNHEYTEMNTFTETKPDLQ